MSIIITDRAFSRIRELIELEHNKDLVLRVSVDSGGCSGLMYNYELESKATIAPDDYVVTKNDIAAFDIIVVIDQVSRNFIEDCTIDYIEELGSSYFNISNPKATAKCGCGNSFTI